MIRTPPRQPNGCNQKSLAQMPEFSTSNKGFTLLEILVAIAILAISLTVILQLFSGGLRSTRVSDRYSRGVFHAREKMEEILVEDRLDEGIREGEFDDAYKWRTRIVRMVPPEEEEKKLFYDFYLAFHDRWINPDEEDTDILQFQAHRQQSIANIETRHIIMRQLFFKYALDNSSNLILKDSDRIFSEYERIKIYRKDKGLCQMCLDVGKSEKEAFVSWKDYDADHIKPHSLGGETSIENGRVLCRYHNRSRGNSI